MNLEQVARRQLQLQRCARFGHAWWSRRGKQALANQRPVAAVVEDDEAGRRCSGIAVSPQRRGNLLQHVRHFLADRGALERLVPYL